MDAMNAQSPKRVYPSKGERQAYKITDHEGRPIVRQSLTTKTGRVLWFDMTPDEVDALIHDLGKARQNAEWAGAKDARYADPRF